MLAHRGEELLIPILVVALVLLVPMLKRRLARAERPPLRRETCAYCGAEIAQGAGRCGACGFRVRR